MLWERLGDWNNLILHTPVFTGDHLQLVENTTQIVVVARRKASPFFFPVQRLLFPSARQHPVIGSFKMNGLQARHAELVRGFLQLCGRSNGIWILTVPQLSLCLCSFTIAATAFLMLSDFLSPLLPNGYGYRFNLPAPFVVRGIKKESYSTP